MISAGEIGGILDTILQRLSIYMEKAMKLKAKIKGAMIYPATIITVAVGVTAVLLIWVIPVFAELFSSFGQALPGADAVRDQPVELHHRVLPLPHRVGGGDRGDSAATLPDRERPAPHGPASSSRCPSSASLIRKSSIARFTRTLSTLVSSGVPILDALLITAKTAGNKVVERAILATRTSISEGNTICRAAVGRARCSPPWCAR